MASNIRRFKGFIEPYRYFGKLSIRLQRRGCKNRPFYEIVVTKIQREQSDRPIEQLGVYDPLPNDHGEKIVSFNSERLRYWIGYRECKIARPVQQLLGLAGFLPIPPVLYMRAWRRRRSIDIYEQKEKEAEMKSALEKESETGVEQDAQTEEEKSNA